ncbi:M48 family metallopeptidase [Methanobrevibacter sp.]|uniref:M48 family metallopeptidase n=1 Tax=Methanobrevibacter sp. TaxID=66852 RepID=UPI0026E097A9|nr:SprT family zinc-dependent metalloprotease [Methanobrevibacter sp.]MDO5824399.1 SprT family zinc-dependent metalloprotease [Methanobrevibacter sp.]
MKKQLIIDGITINLELKNIKNIYLRVIPPNGDVKLSAPSSISDEDLLEFIKSRREWILEKQTVILNSNIQPPLKYVTGEKHYLWGEAYTLKLIKNSTAKQVLADKENSILYLPTPSKNTIEKREEIMVKFYKSQLQEALHLVLDKCIKIVGKSPAEVKIRKMKNWGNCRWHDRTITLNLNLAKKDQTCLEYVLIHELCHLIEFNHGKKFKKLMDKFCPNWKKIKKELNE